MKPEWFKDVHEDWLPYLETLYKESKVEVGSNEMANNIKDAVHHYSHHSVSIEWMDNGFYVMFAGVYDGEK
jgi:hypothetical protein